MSKKTITMIANDFTKVYRSSEQLYVTLLYNNVPLPNKQVSFNINGVIYNRTTGTDGRAKLNINLPSGVYPCTVTSFSDDEYESTSKNITITVVGSELIANDFSKIYGTPDALYVTLLFNKEPLINFPVQFNLNGVRYQRYTDNQGRAKLNINLMPGEYDCTVWFEGDSTHDSTSKSIKITVYKEKPKKAITLLAVDFIKTYGTSDPLKVTLYHQTSPLVNKEVYITINGVTYTRITDDRGEARLNISLIPGEYTTNVVTFSDSEYAQSSKTIKVTVKSNTKMDGTNVTKTYRQSLAYQCAVYDDFNNRVNCEVSLTINGVTYIRKTDSEGLAKLNIRLREGEYVLKAEYKGDATHNPSSITNTVVVLPDITPLTKRASGNYTIPGNNRGFIESHIYIAQFNVDNKILYDIPNWGELIASKKANDIYFTKYEIIDTDPRTMTAKFTTDKYIDLTKGRAWIYITNPFHINFGGRILDIDYDKNTGLYSYQCQDGRRQYISKSKLSVGESTNATIYDILENRIASPGLSGKNTIKISNEQKASCSRLLSGLQPIDNYNNLISGALKFDNKFKEKAPTLLSFDSNIDKIMNFAHIGGFPTDVYFTPDGIVHIDPIDLDTWLNSGIKLTHSDLVHYKYGFDTTNIITSVGVKNGGDVEYYNDWGALVSYFGNNATIIDAVTTSTNNASSNGSSSTSSGNGVVTNPSTGLRDNSGANIAKNRPIVINIDNINTWSQDKKLMEDCATALRNAGYTDVRVSGVGPGYHTSDITSGRVPNNGVSFCIYGGYCAGTFWDMCQPYIQNHVKNRGIQIVFGFTNMPNYRRSQTKHLDKLTWLPRAWDDNFSGLSGLSNPGQYITSRGIHYVYGDNGTELGQNLAKGNSGSGSISSNTNTTSGSSNTVVNTTQTYIKALEEMSKSIRNLLSFQIRVPLNDPLFKNLHTNQMLWTELPSEFKLANLEKIFKILPTYKVNRGVPYQVNRWYVETVKITCDSNGLFADITLNPFPSSFSVYSNAVKSYAEAYDQAYKSSSNTTTSNNTTVSNANNIPARTDGKTDCSDTYSLCCAHTGSSANPSNHGYENRANAQGKIGKEGTNYADYVKGCTPKEAYKKLAKLHNYGNYVGYPDNHHACASNTLYASTSNCGDRARLLKACMDVLGQPCVIYHVYNHYMNGVLINGRWETVDLCYQSGSMPQYQTAGWHR